MKDIKKYLEDDQINSGIDETIAKQTNDHNQFNEKEDKNIYKNSAIIKHQKETNHVIDWQNSQIVWSDSIPHKLLIKESLIIKAYEPEMNRTTHFVPLFLSYSHAVFNISYTYNVHSIFSPSF